MHFAIYEGENMFSRFLLTYRKGDLRCLQVFKKVLPVAVSILKMPLGTS